MAEDGKIGFKFFEVELNERESLIIANEAAVKLRPGVGLGNEIAFEKAFDHLDNARAAVRDAMERKYDVDLDPQDQTDIPLTDTFDL